MTGTKLITSTTAANANSKLATGNFNSNSNLGILNSGHQNPNLNNPGIGSNSNFGSLKTPLPQISPVKPPTAASSNASSKSNRASAAIRKPVDQPCVIVEHSPTTSPSVSKVL